MPDFSCQLSDIFTSQTGATGNVKFWPELSILKMASLHLLGKGAKSPIEQTLGLRDVNDIAPVKPWHRSVPTDVESEMLVSIAWG